MKRYSNHEMIKHTNKAKASRATQTHIKLGSVHMLEKHELVHVIDLLLNKLDLQVKITEKPDSPYRSIKLIPKT